MWNASHDTVTGDRTKLGMTMYDDLFTIFYKDLDIIWTSFGHHLDII